MSEREAAIKILYPVISPEIKGAVFSQRTALAREVAGEAADVLLAAGWKAPDAEMEAELRSAERPAHPPECPLRGCSIILEPGASCPVCDGIVPQEETNGQR